MEEVHKENAIRLVENKTELNQLRRTLGLKPHPVGSVVEVKPSDNLNDLHKDAAFGAWRKRLDGYNATTHKNGRAL